MRTARVRVSSTPSNTTLRNEFGLDGHNPRWSNREEYSDIPATFPETRYEVTLGAISFPELGPETLLPPDACIKLVTGTKRIVRPATLWEQLALLEEDEAALNEMLEEDGYRPVIAWGTTGTVLGTVRCTPVLYINEGKILLPSQGDPFPLGRYTNLVVVE